MDIVKNPSNLNYGRNKAQNVKAQIKILLTIKLLIFIRSLEILLFITKVTAVDAV